MSRLQISLVVQLGPANKPCARHSLTIQDVFWDSDVFHLVNMAEPVQPLLSEQCVHCGEASMCEDICVWLCCSI